MRLTLEKQIIAIVGVFALLAAAVIGLVIIPTAGYIKALNKETEQLKKYLEKRYDTSIQMRSSIKKIEEVMGAIQTFPQYVYHSGEELKLITGLENMASENKVAQKINNSNLDSGNSKKVEINLTANGEYKKVLNYLADLEGQNYFINVEQLQLTSAGARPGETTTGTPTNLNLNLGLYVAQ